MAAVHLGSAYFGHLANTSHSCIDDLDGTVWKIMAILCSVLFVK
ncbi:uncharacterized protein METZ01_LOCUS296009, partial [marine metagenome]